MRKILVEFDESMWRRSDARISKLLAKPAARMMWHRQLLKNPDLFDEDFCDYVGAIQKEENPAPLAIQPNRDVS